MNIAVEPPSLLLDLVNSRLVHEDFIADELESDEAGVRWLQQHGGSGSAEELAGAREVRPLLVAFLRGEADAATLAPWAKALRKRAVLDAQGLKWTLDVADARIIGARAISEWATLQTDAGSRIRPCGNPDCQHFLIDNSKANSRKWHSMDTCGNRMKSRRHYARSKAEASESQLV